VTLVDGAGGERHSLLEGHGLRPHREEIVFGPEELAFLEGLGDPHGPARWARLPAAFLPPCAQSNDTWVIRYRPWQARGGDRDQPAPGQVVAHQHAILGQLSLSSVSA